MAKKVRLTKNELKAQKDHLKRYTRYLPTLELKKKQLLQEIQRIQQHVDALKSAYEKTERAVSHWAGVFVDRVDLPKYIRIKEILTGSGNIAGIDIPVFEDLVFEELEWDTFHLPLWVDYAIPVIKDQVRRKVEWQINQKQRDIIWEELRVTIQRIKLFEEVKIPEARENIRIIQIFLGDQMTAEVVRGKIAKAKIMKKKLARQSV